MRLLVTRPDTDAERTARALEKLGHEAIISPALQIRYLIDAPIAARAPQAILATSVNAVRALKRHRWGKALIACPVLAVGDRTAVEARRAGFAAAFSAAGNVSALYDLVLQHCRAEGGVLLYAAGTDQAGDLAGQLGDAGFQTETVFLYRAEPAGGLSPAVHKALSEGTIDGVLFYSARSARAFGEQLARAGLAPLCAPVCCYCLSDAVAEPVRDFTTGLVRIAASPNQLALFALLGAA